MIKAYSPAVENPQKPCRSGFSSLTSFSLYGEGPRLQAPIDMHIAPKGVNTGWTDPEAITVKQQDSSECLHVSTHIHAQDGPVQKYAGN